MSVLPYSVSNLGKGQDLKIPSFNVPIERKKAIPDELKDAIPEGAIYFEGYANKAIKDRVGDLIVPSFWTQKVLDDYMKNPILLFMHDRKDAAGQILAAEAREDGLFVKGFVSGNWPKAYQVEEGFVKSLSVWVWIDEADYHPPTETFLIKEGSLLEVSLATIPMQSDSVFDVSKSLDAEGFAHFKSIFKQKSFDMEFNFNDWLKGVIPNLKKSFGLEVKEDATPEDVAKAIEEAPGIDKIKSDLTADLTDSLGKSIKGEVLKSLGFELDDDGEIKKSDDNDGEESSDSSSKALEDLQAKFDKMKSDLEGEIATLKGEAGDDKSNSGAPNFATAKSFQNKLGTVSPTNKAKY